MLLIDRGQQHLRNVVVDTERFRIGGRDSVRGYASSELVGDGGYAVLPPSKFPDDRYYQWKISPDMADLSKLSSESLRLLERKD